MRHQLIIASLAAAGLMGTSAFAQTTTGGGVSASTPAGSIAGGATAGSNERMRDKQAGKRHRQHDRRGDAATSNSASTYGSGTIYTDKDKATGGVTAGGSASGTGSQSTSTSIDAYGSTDRNGSTGEVYGDSTADSTNPSR